MSDWQPMETCPIGQTVWIFYDGEPVLGVKNLTDTGTITMDIRVRDGWAEVDPYLVTCWRHLDRPSA